MTDHLEKITYTLKEAVVVSGLSRTSLYEAMSQGKLTSVMVAGRRLIPARGLKSFLLGAEAAKESAH